MQDFMPPEQRDRLFNPWRTSDAPAVRLIAAHVVAMVEDFEAQTYPDRRRRTARSYSNMVAAVQAIVCDLIHRVLTSKGDGRIAVSLRNGEGARRDRYRAPAENRQFPDVVNLLASDGMRIAEIIERGEWETGRRTAIRAGSMLQRFIEHAAISVDDLTLDAGQEIVILKRAKERLDSESASERSLWMDYKDTRTTKRYRSEVRRINEHLRNADIDYTGGRLLDPTDRSLRRYFNNAKFNEGGRLFGGYWQGLKKAQRCVFRLMSVTDSGACRSPIPGHAGHRFRSKPVGV